VAMTRSGYYYWITDIRPYNEIAIKRLIVACWHIPRIDRGGKPEKWTGEERRRTISRSRISKRRAG